MSKSDPWFRMYHATLDNPKVQQLPGEQFKAWINLLCLACRHAGRLPIDSAIAFALRISEAKVKPLLKRFIEAELIDADGDNLVMHDWDTLQFVSDVSTGRVKRHRERQRNVSSPVSATPPEQSRTDTDTERGKASPVDISSLLTKTTNGLALRDRASLPPEERKNRWQGKIIAEAQKTMADAEFVVWCEAFGNGEKWAKCKAEEINAEMRADEARRERVSA